MAWSMIARLCAASNRLRGDTIVRATALAPEDIAFADVTTTNDYADVYVPRFPGDDGQGLEGVSPSGVRMMWTKEMHSSKLQSLSPLDSQTQRQTQSTECTSETDLVINPPSFFDSPFQRQRRQVLSLGDSMVSDQGIVQNLNQRQELGQRRGGVEMSHGRRLATATTNNPVPMVNQYGGSIMATTMTKAIFWGPSWANSTNTNKIAGLDAWYGGYGLSSYTTTVSEYTSTGSTVYPSLHTYTGHIVDLSAVTKYPNATKVTLAEVCNMISKYQIPVAGTTNWYFPVYVDQARPKNYGYCAWHYGGKCAGTPVQYGFFWGGLEYDSSCQVGSGGLSTTISGNGGFTYTLGLNSLANLAAHELGEARTDPLFNNVWGGWYDASGNEISDKCAWTYPPSPLTSFPTGTYTNIDIINGNTVVGFPTTSWKLQGVWSNNAYKNPTSNPTTYTNSKSEGGYKGCITAGVTTTAPTAKPTATPTTATPSTVPTTIPTTTPTISLTASTIPTTVPTTQPSSFSPSYAPTAEST